MTTIRHPYSTATLRTPAPRRRRHLIVLAVIAVIVMAGLVRHFADASTRDYLSADGWPAVGQGAYAVDNHTPHASTHQTPTPIASIAKMMTALLVLEHHPLADSDAGPSFTVTAADATDTIGRRARDESVVPVQEGERLSERDALMAVLLPSANNVAVMLARWDAGSVPAFVAAMNHRARQLDMTQTNYTDPSGYHESTVSTAIDQLRLARAATGNATLNAMVATPSYSLPFAGTVHNTDTLLGTGGFVGLKTGSDDAAGGCFMFHAYRSIDGFNVEIVGVVLGQHGPNLIRAGLYASRQLVDHLAPEPAHP